MSFENMIFLLNMKYIIKLNIYHSFSFIDFKAFFVFHFWKSNEIHDRAINELNGKCVIKIKNGNCKY